MTSSIPFCTDVGFSDYHLALICPACGMECTHHDIVEVFEREDDAREGRHTTITRAQVETDDLMGGNPSVRRQAVRIGLWCEGCLNRLALDVIQHKGTTYLRAHVTGRRDPFPEETEEYWEEA